MKLKRHSGDRTFRLGGFTLAEVLAAMVFLAILIPVVVEGLALSNRAAVVAVRRQTALELADKQLNEFVATGAWATAEPRGDFGLDWPGYRWEFSTRSWPEGELMELTLEVIFEAQGLERRVRLVTLAEEETQ